MSLKKSASFGRVFKEVMQGALNIYEKHCKRSSLDPVNCDACIRLMARLQEYALIAFVDRKPEKKVDAVVYYRFSSICRLASPATYANSKRLDMPTEKIEFSHDFFRNNLGINPASWDKQIRAYSCNLLAEVIHFSVKELERRQDTDENCIDEHSMIEQPLDFKIADRDPDSNEEHHSLLLAPNNANKLKAIVLVSQQVFTTECHTKRFLGRKYRYPLTLSVITLNKTKLVGIKASFFFTDDLREYNSFMPLTLQDGCEVYTDENLKSFYNLFKSKATDLSFHHLLVSDTLKLDARKSRENKRIYSFEYHMVIPFERILTWHAELLHSVHSAPPQSCSSKK